MKNVKIFLLLGVCILALSSCCSNSSKVDVSPEQSGVDTLHKGGAVIQTIKDGAKENKIIEGFGTPDGIRAHETKSFIVLSGDRTHDILDVVQGLEDTGMFKLEGGISCSEDPSSTKFMATLRKL